MNSSHGSISGQGKDRILSETNFLKCIDKQLGFDA